MHEPNRGGGGVSMVDYAHKPLGANVVLLIEKKEEKGQFIF